MNEKLTLEELKQQIQGNREDKIIVKIGVLNDLILQIEKQQKDIDLYIETEIALNNRIIDLEEDVKEYKIMLDMFDNRKYRKKYLKERRKEQPNLLYPDADEIYQRYYEQQVEIEKRDKIIDEMAIYIDLLDIDEDICKNVKDENCDDENLGRCVDCIKQYFERKIEQ